MKTKAWLAPVVFAAMNLAVIAQEEEEPAGAPPAVSTFTGGWIKIDANAAGQVKSATLQTPTSKYSIVLDGMTPNSLNALASFADRPVEVAGIPSMDGKKSVLKIVGQIKDVTASALNGATVEVKKDKEGNPTSITIRASGGLGWRYSVDMKTVGAAIIADLVKMDGKKVVITGEVSQNAGKMKTITSVRQIADPPKPPKPPKSSKPKK